MLLGGCSHDHPGAVHAHHPPLPLLPDGRLRLDKPADFKPLTSSALSYILKRNQKSSGHQNVDSGLFWLVCEFVVSEMNINVSYWTLI